MGKASHILPSGILFKNNSMIFESLKQAVEMDTSDNATIPDEAASHFSFTCHSRRGAHGGL